MSSGGERRRGSLAWDRVRVGDGGAEERASSNTPVPACVLPNGRSQYRRQQETEGDQQEPGRDGRGDPAPIPPGPGARRRFTGGSTAQHLFHYSALIVDSSGSSFLG